MENAFGLIYTGDASMKLRELTFCRSVAAVPFGGRYRSIDFMLSNLVNAGIFNVGIIAQKNYHSLMDHLESGKEWDLHRKRGGLFVLPPFVTHDNTGVYKGTVDAILSCMDFVRHAPQRYVVLTGSHTIYNKPYDEMIKAHIASGADITIMYNKEKPFREDEQFDDLRMRFDESGRVTDLALNPRENVSEFCSCDAFVMEKSFLEYIVEDAYAHARYDFTRDVLVDNVKNLNIRGWEYDGFVARLNSINAYYRHNMAILDKGVTRDLFRHDHPIYTKIKDEFPASYVDDGRAVNCIVADGCIIEGYVENSILFRGVKVGKGAVVKNSIIMQESVIGENANLNCVILDKDVVIGRDINLSGHDSYPVVLRKGAKI